MLENQRSPSVRGGIATLWSPDLDPFVQRLEEGNTRILVTVFDFPESPFCILNCYLPSGTAPKALENFLEDIDMIRELILKYSDKYHVLLIGDLNEDHFNRNGLKERTVLEL